MSSLVTLLMCSENVQLVRVVKSQDARLARYNERCRTNQDMHVSKYFNQLKRIFNLKDVVPKLIENNSNLALSKFEFAETEGDKQLFGKTKALSNAITSLKYFFDVSIFLSVFLMEKFFRPIY
jgi:hypothetical protein